MPIWGAILWWAGTTIVEALLGAATRPSRSRKAPDPEKFNVPTAEEGRPIPWLWGTRVIRNPNLTWYETPSPVAIVESGVTTGYKYYMSGRYVFCWGPLDEIIDVQYNEKPIGASINSSNDTLVFGHGAPDKLAKIPRGNYGSDALLAAALEGALEAASPGDDFKVTFGFKIMAGVNDEILYGVRDVGGAVSKRIAHVVAGDYPSGATLAAAIQSAMNNVERRFSPRGAFSVTYGAVGQANKFTITYDAEDGTGYRGWFLYGTPEPTFSVARTIKSTIGYYLHVNHVGGNPFSESADTVHADVPMLLNRFGLAYVGSDVTVYLSDARSTAAGRFGLDTSTNAILLIKDGDVDFVAISAVYTDHPDFLQIDIDDPLFFGTEGGIQGRIDIYKGKQDQAASAFLTSKFGTTASRYPGEVYAVLHDLYIGNNNMPKPFAITMRRCPNTLGLPDETHNITGDANPAAMIWELCTEERVMLGMREDELDKDPFLELGQTLYDERLGLSMVLDTVRTGEEAANEIARHVDVFIYEDPVTDLVTVKAARADYEIADLPLISIDNADDIKLTRPSLEETRNLVRVTYVDRALGFTDRVVQVENQANIQTRGGYVSIEESSFQGFSNEDTARRWALRLLRLMSRPPAHLENLSANREMWRLRPGSPFRFTCEPLGITDMPCRATRVSPGPLGQSQILIDAAEDVIGPAWTGFIAPTVLDEDLEDPTDLPPPAPGGSVEIFEGQAIPTL